MNGFSGFGNSSPAKQTKETQATRQDSINAVDAKIENLYEDLSSGKITKKEYDEKRKALGPKEREVKKALPKEGDMKKYSDLEKYDDDQD